MGTESFYKKFLAIFIGVSWGIPFISIITSSSILILAKIVYIVYAIKLFNRYKISCNYFTLIQKNLKILCNNLIIVWLMYIIDDVAFHWFPYSWIPNIVCGIFILYNVYLILLIQKALNKDDDILSGFIGKYVVNHVVDLLRNFKINITEEMKTEFLELSEKGFKQNFKIKEDEKNTTENKMADSRVDKN